MKIGNYELETPLINGGGVVKTLEEAEMMARTGVGAVLGGSYTLLPRIGNSPSGERVWYFDDASGLMRNSLGMPNKGSESIAASYLQPMIDVVHSHNKPFILNFAPVSEEPASETEAFFEVLEKNNIEGIDAVELNAGCPNVITEDGGRHELLSHHLEKMASVLRVMGEIATTYNYGDIFVRISPFQKQEDADELVRVIKPLNVSAVTAFNTFPGEIGKDNLGEKAIEVEGERCGHSGRAMQNEAEKQTIWLADARQSLTADFEIIGSNGVHDATSMKRRLGLGAAVVSATTFFYISTRNWSEEVDRLLLRYSEII